MSHSYKEQNLKAKEIRQAPLEDDSVRHKSSKSKKNLSKDWIVECRSPNSAFLNEWTKWGTYRDEKTANQALKQLEKSYKSWEFRVVKK